MAELGVDVARLRAEVAAEWTRRPMRRWPPMPEPATAADGVFCEGEPEPLGDGAGAVERLFSEAR